MKLLHGWCERLLECLDLEVRRVKVGLKAYVRILEDLLCIDVLVGGSERRVSEGVGVSGKVLWWLEGLGGSLGIQED